MKKIILVILLCVVCLLGASGFIFEKIILSCVPSVLTLAQKENVKISFDDIKSDSGFARVKLMIVKPQVEIAQRIYQAESLSLNISLFSFRTITGEISGNISSEQIKIQSEPILFTINLDTEKKITLTTKKMTLFSPKEMLSVQVLKSDVSWVDEHLFGAIEGRDILFPAVSVKPFSEMKRLFLDMSYQRSKEDMMIEKSEFDFDEVKINARGRIQAKKESFILDVQVRGWEKVLQELTSLGFISKSKQKWIVTALRFLSVRGVLRAPLKLEKGLLYIGGHQVIDLRKNIPSHP